MSTQKTAAPGGPTINIPAMLKGTLYAFIIALVFTLLAGVIMFYTTTSDSWLGAVATFIYGLCIFCGGTAASFKAGRKGLFHGIGVGVIFLILAMIFSGLIDSASVTAFIFIKKLVIAVIAGAMGGVLGVGISRG